jgi:two-component sensor histidine kinase
MPNRSIASDMNHPDPASRPDLDRILRVLGHASTTVFSQDTGLRYRWIESPPKSWKAANIAGRSDADVLSPAAAAIATAAKHEVLSSGHSQWVDLAVETDQGTEYFDLFVEPERDKAGTIVGIIGLAINGTNRRKQAETLEAVARDLSHRSKNLLAVIQSLATQTARAAPSPEVFIEEFRGRIQSISRSQDLSIGAKHRGAHLAELVETQVVPYVIDPSRRIDFKGVDCQLTPNAALHVGLALYELCIDAVRSGALSVPTGKVLVTAELVAASPPATDKPLRMTWRESDGPNGADADGFGKILLERIVPQSVGGRAALTQTDRGRSYELTISPSEFI